MSKKNFADLSKEERAGMARQVKPLRLQQGMTQRQLAELAGLDRTTIVNMERGGEPQAEKLKRVLTVLGVETDIVEFDPQTQLWLTTMGTLIEAIPESRRQKHVDIAIGDLAAGIRDTQESNVIQLNVGGMSEAKARALGAVASDMEGGPEDEDA